MQNQTQIQLQEFLNNVQHIQNTPPDRTKQVLANIRNFYEQVQDQQMLGFAFLKFVDTVLRFKQVAEHIRWLIDQCIMDIISKSAQNQFRVGVQALKSIFDPSLDYYRHNNLDPSLFFPLGSNRKLNWYEPAIGEAVDVVKPYITSTSFCSWTRGILLSKQNKKFTVKYDNTQATATYKQMPFFAPLGTHTPDYDWRMNLEVGSIVDAFNRVWYPSTVTQTGFQNGSKRVRISYRRFSQNGQKVDSLGYRYDGLGQNEDDWIDVLSYRIQKPGKMAFQLCYYSHNSQQPMIDDTYDLLFARQYQEEPFWGVMRCSIVRSTSYLNFFEHLCNSRGYEIYLSVLKQKDYPIDILCNLFIVFGFTSQFTPRMGINLYLPKLIQASIEYLKQNHKNFVSWRLDCFSLLVQNVSKRIFSLSKKHKIINQLKKFLIVQYFKFNLQKNMIALKYLYELIKPLRPYQNDKDRQEFNNFLVDSQIFYTIVQNNVHQQVLSRSGEIIKYMISNNLIGWAEIQHMWSIIPHSDLRGRATIQKLLGEISQNFYTEYTEKLIDILVNIKETELTIDKVNLIKTLKNRDISSVYKQKILSYLWQCLTVKSANIKQNVEEEIENVYRSFISTLKQSYLKLSVIKAMVKRLQEINTVKNQMYLFREFILTYPTKPDANSISQEGQFPVTIPEVLVYLKSENIYQIVYRLLQTAKTKDKISSILEFLQFLFDHDSDDISDILKLVYDILGPSDIFLAWAKNLTFRALNFFVEMYQNANNMQKFEKITADGLQAIKAILLDINVYKGNIKVLKKRKVTQFVGPLPIPIEVNNQSSTSVGTSTQNYSTMPQKQQTLTFVYILKSPFECIGLAFLLQLLQYISSNKVYNDIIKLIIQFIVNLDDKIRDKSEQFMEQFLRRVIQSMEAIGKASELTSNNKIQIDTYLNLIQELFCQTQKNGLGNIVPHFTLMQSEIIKLKIENNILNSTLHKKEPLVIQINQNATLWALKVKLSEIYQLSSSKIDVTKYSTPIQETNNGKSLSELFFFNEELIKISKRDPQDIPRFDLLQDDNETPTQRFQKILLKWFKEYKNQRNLMGLQELKRLGNQNWKGSIMKQEDKIKQVLEKEDKDKKGGLTWQQFKNYFAKTSYLQSAKIWKIINLSGYKNNLKHKEQPEAQLKQNSFPRKILSTKFVYQTIFNILQNETFQPIHLNLYRFLSMLETDHQFCNYIKSNIKDFLQNQKCIYKLSYGLEALINQLQSNLDLFGQFYQQNGHNQIAKKLTGYFNSETSVYKFQQFLKIIVVPNLLKILNLYAYPLISNNKQIRFLKKIKINQLDTLDVIKKLESQENYAPDQNQKRSVLASKSNTFNFYQLYNLSLKILDNLIINYEKEFLVRITNQIVKLYGYLALVNPQFKPEDIFMGCNSQSLNIRRSCHALIFFYLLKNKQKSFELLQKLIQNAPQQTKTLSNTYFDLITLIIEKTIQFSPDNQANDQFFKKLSVFLVITFFKAPNQTRGTILPNKTLNGLLSNLLIILQKKHKIGQYLSIYRQDLIRCGLFAYNIKQEIDQLQINEQLLLSPSQPQHFQNYVKCKSQDNRKILMEIIYYLYKYSKDDHSLFFDRFILPIMNEIVDTSKKNSLRTTHVGLTNFGSTCYLNSMLQALNSTDIFRNAIMKVQVQSPLLHQLKQLFSFLFFSQRVDYAPKNLLSAFVPQINPGLQQDTTQFLNFLFDQLEDILKKTPYKNLLYELFQGNQVAQMICHSCGAKRQRIQHFFTYSVEIEGKYDLHSALEGMHGGQLISDCLCQSCGKRSDTTKRNVLNVVPNIFFVHLKRIVFDYNMFINTKIHTRLYFPEELNFEPFTKQGLELREKLGVEYLKTLADNQQQRKKFQELALHGHPKEYYQLKLKGVIVHSGTPDVGHYYAIIKKDKNWIKFDDARVTSFGMNMFEQQCYGGNWVADEWGGSGSSKNAYVLVYEKEMKKDIQLEIATDSNTIQRKLVDYQEYTKVTNTPEWYKKVWLDNHSLMLEQHLISENYTKEFLSFVCHMLELIESRSTIDLISQIFFKISALSGQVGNLPLIFEKNLHLIKKQHFHTYVTSDSKRTFNLLFHQQAKIRDFASFYMERILINYYLNGNQEEKGEIKKFIETYLYLLHQDAAKNWLRIDGYFKMFQRIIRSACIVPELQSLYHFFIGNDVLAYFTDFALEKASPLNLVQKKYSLGTKSNPLNFNAGLQIIFLLLQRSFGMTGMNYQSPSVNINYLHHLSDNAINCLCSMTFYQKMIKENQNPQAISAIIERLSIQNLAFSEQIARVLLKIVTQNIQLSDQLETVLLCIRNFLRINDVFWIKRAEAILGVPTPFIYLKNLLTSLDQEKYVYPSVLENMFPIESLLNYAHINRQRVPLTVLNILKTILEGTSISDQAMDYLLKIPSPSYLNLRYIDWIRPYVNNVISRLNLTDKKIQQVLSKISLCNLYLDDLQKRKTQMRVLLLGQIGQKQLIYTKNSQAGDIEYNVYNVPVHVTQSLPNGQGNDAFDKYLTNCRLQKPVTADSNILKFFKQSGKPLAIKAQYIQEQQEKQLTSLFDQTPYDPSNNSTSNQIETNKIQEMGPKQTHYVVETNKIQEMGPKQTHQVVETNKIQEMGPKRTHNEVQKEYQAETSKWTKQQKKQEQLREQINVENIFVSQDYLRCIEIINKSDSNKVTILNFNNPTQSNATVPSSVKFMVSKGRQEFYYTKEHPYKQWGDDTFADYVFPHIQNPRLYFRLYPNPFAQLNQQTNISNEKVEYIQNISQKDPNAMDIQVKKDENNQMMNSQMDGMINCRECTYFNPITNANCEVCQSPL